MPASLQGEEAILEDNTCLTLPSTTPQDNRDMATINASISGTTLHISRREEMSGALKEHFQPYLIMDEDLYNSVRRQLGITATIYDETKENSMPTCAKVTAVNGSRRKSVTVMKSSVIMARKKDWKHSSATSFSASETGQTVRHLPIKWTMYWTDT